VSLNRETAYVAKIDKKYAFVRKISTIIDNDGSWTY